MTETRHRGGSDTAEKYQGIPVHAFPGVHQTVADLLKARLPAGGRIADLGAGHGALSQRLHDAGYSVAAFDLDCGDWVPTDVACEPSDLNGDLEEIARRGPFDAICILDVVAHLENPRRFVQELLKLRKPEGSWLLLTMPNPLDTFSCIAMFTRGIFSWAGPQQYQGGGHISVLPHWLLEAHLRHHGVQAQEWRFLSPYRHPSSLKRGVYSVVAWLRRRLARSTDTAFFEGQTALLLARI
jgi:SAM-dependent methyltransferase